jgi:hypothetical protein
MIIFSLRIYSKFLFFLQHLPFSIQGGGLYFYFFGFQNFFFEVGT